MNFAVYTALSAATPNSGSHFVNPYPFSATASALPTKFVPGFTFALTSAPVFVPTFTVPFVASSDLNVTVI